MSCLDKYYMWMGFPMLHIKFELTTCWMSASLRRSHEKVVRIGRIPRNQTSMFSDT